MKSPERKELFHHVESLLGQYCNGCFVHQQFKKESGRRFAHHFCISQCTVGEKLQEYGKKLT